MFAEDVVLENLEEVNYKLDEWRLALDGKGLSMTLEKKTKRLKG